MPVHSFSQDEYLCDSFSEENDAFEPIYIVCNLNAKLHLFFWVFICSKFIQLSQKTLYIKGWLCQFLF